MGLPDAAGVATFELCVMDGPYGAITRLTFNNISELTPTWSPDGLAIVFHKVPSNQLWVMRADGTGETQSRACLEPAIRDGTCWPPVGV